MMLVGAALLDPEASKTIGIVSIMLGAFASAVLYPLARAYARRIEGAGDTAGLRRQVADLTAEVEELLRDRVRLTELEERLEFTERVLAQAREREQLRLPGGPEQS